MIGIGTTARVGKFNLLITYKHTNINHAYTAKHEQHTSSRNSSPYFVCRETRFEQVQGALFLQPTCYL